MHTLHSQRLVPGWLTPGTRQSTAVAQPLPAPPARLTCPETRCGALTAPRRSGWRRPLARPGFCLPAGRPAGESTRKSQPPVGEPYLSDLPLDWHGVLSVPPTDHDFTPTAFLPRKSQGQKGSRRLRGKVNRPALQAVRPSFCHVRVPVHTDLSGGEPASPPPAAEQELRPHSAPSDSPQDGSGAGEPCSGGGGTEGPKWEVEDSSQPAPAPQ